MERWTYLEKYADKSPAGIVYDENGNVVAYLACPNMPGITKERAALIVAAPAMLAMLETISARGGDVTDQMLAKIDALVADAKGGAK
jgi:hypothetical protein